MVIIRYGVPLLHLLSNNHIHILQNKIIPTEVPKWRMNKETFIKYSKRFGKDEQHLNFTCIGHAIVDFLNLGKMTYDVSQAYCEIEDTNMHT